MGWLVLWLGLAFGTQIWLCFRVGRSSVALAIVTFFIGFPGALYTFFTHRDDPQTSVTVPFVANVVFSLLFFVSVWQVLLPRLDALDDEFDQSVVASTPMVERPLASAAPASAELSASAASLAASVASGAQTAPPPDAVDAFSAALREGGLNHTVTRLPASASLPAGVTGAALFSVTPMGSGAVAAASAASAASAPAANELSATLFKCESAHACRNLAGAYLQQTGDEKRRVLQNGLLLLSLPPSSAGDADLTPAAVASVFRKLSP